MSTARTFESFLPPDYDYLSDDCSSAIVTAAEWSVANNCTVVFSCRYRIENCATITVDGVSFVFENARFDVLDSGTPGTLTSGTSGKVGILFRGADRLHLTGAASFYGQGAAGTTSLAGVIFDNCDDAIVPAHFHFEIMAAGVMHISCERGDFGPVTGVSMWGRQTFGATGTAGTLRNTIGCLGCCFGSTHGENNYKPILYCSVDGGGADNRYCHYGMVSGSGRVASEESVGIALRSARDCTFDGINGRDFVVLLDMVRYVGDAGYSVDGNIIGKVSGKVAATSTVFDAAIEAYGQDDTVPIGSNIIHSVHVEGDLLTEAGILTNSGHLRIGQLHASSFKILSIVTASTLEVGTFVAGRHSEQAILLFTGARFTCEFLDIQAGSAASNNGVGHIPVQAAAAAVIDSVEIGSARYRGNGIGAAPTHVFYDGVAGPGSWTIGNVDNEAGVAGVADAQFAGVNYVIRKGLLKSTAAPTGGAFKLGDVVWNSAPTASSAKYWICTTAGPPGTWTAV